MFTKKHGYSLFIESVHMKNSHLFYYRTFATFTSTLKQNKTLNINPL